MNSVKYKSISAILEDNINNDVYSDKLPPVRSLSAEFKVSTRTMNKALKLLVTKGLIIPNGPQGNMISKKSVIRAKTNIVAIFCHSDSPDLNNDPMLKELKSQIESDGYKILFMNAPDPNIFDNEQFWSSNWVDGYIFAYSSIEKELAYKLHKKSVPFIVANRLPPECGAHWVEFNLKKTLKALVKASIEAGRKRIMLACARFGLTSYREYIKQVWDEIQKEFSQEYAGEFIYLSGRDDQKNGAKCANKFAESQSDSLILLGIPPSIVETKLAIMGHQIIEDYLLSYRSHQIDTNSNKSSYAVAPYQTLANDAWNLFRKVLDNPELEPQNILVDENVHINKISTRRNMPIVKKPIQQTVYAAAEV